MALRHRTFVCGPGPLVSSTCHGPNHIPFPEDYLGAAEYAETLLDDGWDQGPCETCGRLGAWTHPNPQQKLPEGP